MKKIKATKEHIDLITDPNFEELKDRVVWYVAEDNISLSKTFYHNYQLDDGLWVFIVDKHRDEICVSTDITLYRSGVFISPKGLTVLNAIFKNNKINYISQGLIEYKKYLIISKLNQFLYEN